MRTYSIKELENYSGTKAHTIRIWEQRYNLLTPERTDTGIRFYNDLDLKKILSTSVLLKAGFKISKIAKFDIVEINNELDKIDGSKIKSDTKIELYISNLLASGLVFNENKMNSEFEKINKSLDTYSIITSIFYPLLQRIGIMWGKNDINPIQEHFISNFIKQKLNVAIEKLPGVIDNSNELVLFLPEEETHDIGLLFANFILKLNNIKTIYLGQQVPTSGLNQLIKDRKIKKALGFIFFSPGKEKLLKAINNLSMNSKQTHFYWAGNSDTLDLLTPQKNQTLLYNMSDFNHFLVNPNK
jgi:DNA-binding transcriptional MerR regulator